MNPNTHNYIEETEEATKMLVLKAWREEESVTTVVNKINFLWRETLEQELTDIITKLQGK